MNPEKRISEIITLILGGIGNFMLFAMLIDMMEDSGGFAGLGGLLILLIQFIVATIALPFLIKSFRRDIIMRWFAKIVVAESILNSLLTIGQFLVWPDQNLQLFLLYMAIALMQLIPLIFYSKNKERISSYEFYEDDDLADIDN